MEADTRLGQFDPGSGLKFQRKRIHINVWSPLKLEALFFLQKNCFLKCRGLFTTHLSFGTGKKGKILSDSDLNW